MDAITSSILVVLFVILVSGIVIIYVVELFITRYKKLHKLIRKKRIK